MAYNLVTDWEKLTELIQPIVEQAGYQLHKLDVVEEDNELLLQVVIDSSAGISVDDCVLVTNQLNPVLDQNEALFNSAYILDVCSKGMEE